MARIRTIKPEFWTDESVVELSAYARLLFIGLWNFCDDDGRLVYSPKRLRLQIFPADDVDVPALVGEMRREGLVEVYTVENKEYLQVRNFFRHQKVDRRSASKHPPPPIPAESLRAPPSPPDGREGKGIKEGKGREGNIQDAKTQPDGVSTALTATGLTGVQAEFAEFWLAYPEKTRKRDAAIAFAQARRTTSLNEIMEGLLRYVRDKPPDRQWLSPVNWLEQQRWTDELAPRKSKSGLLEALKEAAHA